MFASRFGAEGTTAAIWPLIVDGLLTLATAELWRGQRGSGRSLAWAVFSRCGRCRRCSGCGWRVGATSR
ncbi:hypothetical protein [Amycolatopsis benzoatilytica]|uniref:hypothetical protein n=1 Tax=Amycolatopsis benzoatilytica TaxID=346045 RepID=UPI003CCBFD62